MRKAPLCRDGTGDAKHPKIVTYDIGRLRMADALSITKKTHVLLPLPPPANRHIYRFNQVSGEEDALSIR
ncbi:hypothetical protein FHR32_002168 [Streptosporangium album]|uniref:Uncharacterized protein n=1 Tax=Streptosporangium album TaxID=47479 RepID=A0A7W7RTD4_9ACTN|nr:hypothetical protein [Streptosporangium album]